MKKSIVVLFLLLVIICSCAYAYSETNFYYLSECDVPNLQDNKMDFWNFIPAVASALAAIFSAIVAFLTYQKSKPDIKISFFRDNMFFFEVRNNGNAKAFVKITNYYIKDGKFKILCDERARFSSLAKKWINFNHSNNLEDEIVHDRLYEIEPLEIMSFTIDNEEYNELCSNNGGFFIRDTSGRYQLYEFQKNRVRKMNDRQVARFRKYNK